MPQHHFICRECGDKIVIQSSIRTSPPHPYCTNCHRTYAKVFGFRFTEVQNEINSPSVGKHGSTRSYNTALDRHSDEHSQRTGREVKYDSFSPHDTDQSPLS